MAYEVYGLASINDYVGYNVDCPSTQQILDEEYELGAQLPDLASIEQVMVNAEVLETEVIRNSFRPKAVLTARVEIKVAYVTTDEESLHRELIAWEIPMLVEIPFGERNSAVIDSRVVVEHVSLQKVHGRKIKIRGLFFAYLQIG